jgi:hypothetical protein
MDIPGPRFRMPRHALHETLEQLHDELEQTRSLDPDSRAQLEELLVEIRALLDRSGGGDHASFVERLRQATRHFEESHPTLTAAVGRVADALANMGI